MSDPSAHLLATMGGLKMTSVVFDTNAYRRWACDDIAPSVVEVRAKQDRMKHVSYASPHVMIELMAHFADGKDPAFFHCLRAVSLLWGHCWKDPHLLVRADAESMVAMWAFGQKIPGHDEATEKLCVAARHVAIYGKPWIDINNSGGLFFRGLSDQVAQIEKQFVDDMMNHVVKTLNPSSLGWNPELPKEDRRKFLDFIRGEEFAKKYASVLLWKASIQVGQKSCGISEDKKVAEFLEVVCPALSLYREILERLAGSGVDVSKNENRNWIWDMQILLGMNQGLEAKEVYPATAQSILVTGDRAMKAAADKIGLGTSVMTLDEYWSRLGLVLLPGSDKTAPSASKDS